MKLSINDIVTFIVGSAILIFFVGIALPHLAYALFPELLRWDDKIREGYCLVIAFLMGYMLKWIKGE